MKTESSRTIPHLRWIVCGLLFLASSINYIDRQTLSVLKPHLQDLYRWSESDYGWIVFSFQAAYAIMMVFSGRIIDRIGTKPGYALAIACWSLAAMAHALARGVFSFGLARFLLGAGEAGNFPAAIKTTAEWFPKKERAFATGIFNAGTNVGAVIAPPIVVWLTLEWGWRAAFVFTGAVGFAWLALWLVVYRPPEAHPWLAKEELALIQSDSEEAAPKPQRPWKSILRIRKAQGFILAKFMTDPIWWFFIFWLPSYLKTERGFTLKMIGYFAWIPFLAADIGSVFGGWLSSFLIKRGWTVNRARKTAMAVCAFMMPAGIVAVFTPNVWVALALISVAASAHQGWSANVFTLSSDLFAKKDVGAVVGLGGSGGAIGGMILSLTAGYILQFFGTYVPLFIIAGIMHPLAFLLIQFVFIPVIEPVRE
jgi:ACS family hexuronate transporter-like MFS transporter